MKLIRSDLMSLENYAGQRNEFRARVMAHKKNRHIQLGENARLLFEDRLTVQYQIQEMLRIERIFEAEAIAEELAAYNPLIPDGDNWKATLMLEYPDVNERRVKLAGLLGIENRVWAQVEGFDRIYAIADEDLDRATDEKTSSVHFLRFQFDSNRVAAAKAGARLALGIDHPNYRVSLDPLPEKYRQALVADFD
ncbi:MAG: DUF3501 family protein [Porticoccaceae bacterium]|nr:DUF3501 family protein [Porticoccaceae bacterium]